MTLMAGKVAVGAALWPWAGAEAARGARASKAAERERGACMASEVFLKSFEIKGFAILLTMRIGRNRFIVSLPAGHDK